MQEQSHPEVVAKAVTAINLFLFDNDELCELRPPLLEAKPCSTAVPIDYGYSLVMAEKISDILSKPIQYSRYRSKQKRRKIIEKVLADYPIIPKKGLFKLSKLMEVSPSLSSLQSSGRAMIEVFWTLIDFADGRTGLCNPSYRNIAYQAGYSEMTVWKALKWLKDHGVIFVISCRSQILQDNGKFHHLGQENNVYLFLLPSEWKLDDVSPKPALDNTFQIDQILNKPIETAEFTDINGDVLADPPKSIIWWRPKFARHGTVEKSSLKHQSISRNILNKWFFLFKKVSCLNRIGPASGRALRPVFRALSGFINWRTGLCDPSWRTIARLSRYSRTTVWKALKCLKEHRVIHVISCHVTVNDNKGTFSHLEQDTNVYRFLPPSEWKLRGVLPEPPPPLPKTWGAAETVDDLWSLVRRQAGSLAERIFLAEAAVAAGDPFAGSFLRSLLSRAAADTS